MTLRANPFRALPIMVAFFLNVLIGPLAPMYQLASQPVLALARSSFHATDGNLTDNGPETDWCTGANLTVTRDSTPTSQIERHPTPRANNKEDSNVPPLSLGTIPNNKDDLPASTSRARPVGGDLFVYLAWIRADDKAPAPSTSSSTSRTTSAATG